MVANVMAEKQPNILWIITDDQRADSLECYNRATTGKNESYLGYVSSPNVDALAKEGVLFTKAVCNSPMCTPSRGSMQSGRYPHRRGQYRWGTTHQMPDFVKPMVSQTLRDKGYGTAVFGKTGWGTVNSLNKKENSPADFYDFTINFASDLQRNGVGDIFTSGGKYIFPHGIFTPEFMKETIIHPQDGKMEYYKQDRHNPLPERDLAIKDRVEEEFDILRSYTRLNTGLILGGVNPYPAGETIDGHVVREMKNYLKNADKSYQTSWGKKVKGADTSKPLFINLGFTLPHTPVIPPKVFRDVFRKKKYRIPEFSTDELSNFPPQLVIMYNECKTDQLTEEEKHQAIQDYYAFCAYGDALIGESVEAFKEYCEKQGEEYLIVYTVGDHGWHLGEQGMMAKFGPWTQSIMDAAIIVSSDKEKYPAGKIHDEFVEFVDFAPTMLAAAGEDVSDPKYGYLDGYDLAEVLTDEELKREYAIGELNVICGHRGFMRTEEFAFSMRTRDKWDHSRVGDLNSDIMWALDCERPKADMALYDLRVDPLEKNNVADAKEYRELADWFRQKLGTILLGDGRVECDWSKPNSYSISNFAGGADDKKFDVPPELIPEV
ncbi:sulfatase-like hydrolase/transferase [Pelagicoccus mobilis]|uniref:Sulfatase-like hydrolase/transferase n=2 Tax=Pelagicoccus mobilis TaxID=415221 RepID=A0A934RXH3_9BACT|nr:sulfatase-like hydrolase/transferase [Pelagicoccus mobilis]